MAAPLEAWQHVARTCIARAVFFGSFAIFLLMLGLAWDPVMALRAGAILTLLMAAILLIKAWEAVRKPPRRTETWLHLAESHRPRNPHAARTFALTLREVYAVFARRALASAVAMFAASVLVRTVLMTPA